MFVRLLLVGMKFLFSVKPENHTKYEQVAKKLSVDSENLQTALCIKNIKIQIPFCGPPSLNPPLCFIWVDKNTIDVNRGAERIVAHVQTRERGPSSASVD